MNTRDPSPLDAEERALAARLARHAPSGAPSAELDARILASAHRAAASPVPSRDAGSRARPSRRRWPALTGLAALVALAAGIAWQLRPVPEAPPGQDEAASLSPSTFRAPPDGTSQRTTANTSSPATVSPPAPLAVGTDTPVAAASVADAPPERSTRARPAAARDDDALPQAARDNAAASAARAAPTATSQAEAAMAASAQREAADEPGATPMAMPKAPAPTAVGRRAMRGAPAPLRAAVDAADAGSDLRADADAAGFAEEELDDSPPATADSPQVHRAWLQRIRELRDDGRIDDARASLAELQRRFPDLAVPDDLAPLAAPAR